MKRNSFLLLPISLCLAILFGCKTDEPIETKLQIDAPKQIVNQTIKPDTSYTFSVSTKKTYNSVSFSADLLKSDGTKFNISQSNESSLILKYCSDSLPDDLWKRGGKDNTHIVGQISFSGNLNNSLDTANYNFLIPFKPNKPQLILVDTTMKGDTMTAKINFHADGATRYRIQYFAYGESAQWGIAINDKADTSYTFTNLKQKKYSVFVTADNEYGSSESDDLVFGKELVSQLAMVLTKVGTNLKYRFKLGTEYVENLSISGVNIYDLNNEHKMTISAGVNQNFSVEELTTGMYILSVEVENDKIYSKAFLR